MNVDLPESVFVRLPNVITESMEGHPLTHLLKDREILALLKDVPVLLRVRPSSERVDRVLLDCGQCGRCSVECTFGHAIIIISSSD